MFLLFYLFFFFLDFYAIFFFRSLFLNKQENIYFFYFYIKISEDFHIPY